MPRPFRGRTGRDSFPARQVTNPPIPGCFVASHLALIPHPTVGWPASDPLGTSVGGTYLCTDPTNTASRVVDSTDPPIRCQSNPGQAEVGWIDSGGGYSHVFGKPDYQDTLPAGSTSIDTMRGVPDVRL